MQRAGFYKWALAAALIVSMASLFALAQAPAAVKYAKSSEVKLKGTVSEVKTIDGIVHLMLK